MPKQLTSLICVAYNDIEIPSKQANKQRIIVVVIVVVLVDCVCCFFFCFGKAVKRVKCINEYDNK